MIGISLFQEKKINQLKSQNVQVVEEVKKNMNGGNELLSG
jgi:uncharacterized protein YccT (UPF0319 family)